MGFGGPIGGAAASGLLGSGGGGGGGNISKAGAPINQGRAMAERGVGGGSVPGAGGNGSSGVQIGSTNGGASTDGASTGSGTASGSGGGAPFGGEDGPADFEAQAFNRAVWGEAEQSQASTVRELMGGGKLQQVADVYMRPTVTPNQLIGLVGELKLAEVLESQNMVVFRDWRKHVSGNGIDVIAFDPQSGKVWLIDNKAQIRGISAADSLAGQQFGENKAAAQAFLEKISPHPRAAEALRALDRDDFIKVVSNAWAGDSTRFTKSMIEDKGLAVYDIRLQRLFTEFIEWEKAFLAMPRGTRRVGVRGTATVEGMLLAVAVAGGILFALRSGENLASTLGEIVAETALGAVLSRLPGGFFAGVVIGLESDESPSARAACKREETINTIVQSVPNFSSMSVPDQKKTKEEIGKLLDDPLLVDLLSEPSPARPRQILPGLFSPVAGTDWA